MLLTVLEAVLIGVGILKNSVGVAVVLLKPVELVIGLIKEESLAMLNCKGPGFKSNLNPPGDVDVVLEVGILGLLEILTDDGVSINFTMLLLGTGRVVVLLTVLSDDLSIVKDVFVTEGENILVVVDDFAAEGLLVCPKLNVGTDVGSDLLVGGSSLFVLSMEGLMVSGTSGSFSFVAIVNGATSGKLKVTCLSCLALFCGEMMDTGFFSVCITGLFNISSDDINTAFFPAKLPNNVASLFLRIISSGLSSNILSN